MPLWETRIAEKQPCSISLQLQTARGKLSGGYGDRKDGVIRGYDNTLITDLPGIYSMSPYSSEEIVTREFVIGEKPKGIIDIVDATNIERNMYLTMQLLRNWAFPW